MITFADLLQGVIFFCVTLIALTSFVLLVG